MITDRLPGYAELHCASYFSFLRGASSPESLVAQAAALGYHALAITDECSMAGIVRAHTEAKKYDLPLIIGTELRLNRRENTSQVFCRIILLAQNREGYGNLCELITLGRRRAEKGHYLLYPEDIEDLADCLVILVPSLGPNEHDLEGSMRWLACHFKRYAWVGLTRLHHAQEHAYQTRIQELATHNELTCVAVGQVEMHKRSRKPLHDVLAAVRLRKPVAQCGYELAMNAEQHLRPRIRLASLYLPALMLETIRIAELCSFSLDELRYEYPEEIVPIGQTLESYLKEQTWLGATRRYPEGIPEIVGSQLVKELALINELRYEAYFLTVYDLILFARERKILCQGRGSAANSAVCYCLGITEVNPANGNALFERFISRERNEPPDIDVDFEHQRREEVIQYLYQKYGRHRAALTAVVTSYRPRSALRDTGRALNIDPDIIDKVAKSHKWWDGKTGLIDRLVEAGLDRESIVTSQWAELAQALLGFPRHLSQHPGGFVLAKGALSRLVPIENAAMADRSVVQWDKDDLDAVGLLKVDVLALGMLTVIRRALAWVAWRRKLPNFTMQDIQDNDPATFSMICQADTVGVFQIESRAQMSMLPRLKPACFYDLVIEVAIVRPGPIQGGMIHPYLRRRQGLEPVTYPSKEVESVLKRTLGVPIFQEQVMKIAMVAAGFTAGEADALRRSMAAWRRKGGVDQFRTRLIDGLLARGYESVFAEAIFRQIEGFGEYGFPESHAASFAWLAYVSAWLKCHEPEAFLAALLNSQPVGFYAPAQLIQDAKRHGVEIDPVDVQCSDWDCQLVIGQRKQDQVIVRLGLNQISGLKRDTAQRIVEARSRSNFADLADLAKRAELDAADLKTLAQADALKSLSGHRHQASWDAAAIKLEQDLMGKTSIVETDVVLLEEPSEAQSVVADYRHLGFTLGRHPVALLRPALQTLRFATAGILADYPSGRLARACGLVTVRQRPGTAKGIIFVTLEDETGCVNIIVQPALALRQRRELLQSSLLGVIGVWQNTQGVRHLLAGRLEDQTVLLGQLSTASRNFH